MKHFRWTMIFLLTGSYLLSAEPQKIIFDCDLAGDIDDAYALALILSSPELEVLGLVMDHGYTAKRAQVACRLLYETGREDIPVVVGRQTDTHYNHQFHWAEGFEKITPVKESAAEFIIRLLDKYPDEIVLLTVGPVPNMLDVLEKEPGILKKAKQVVSMFGSFYMGYDGGPVPDREWNVRADVQASRAFVQSGADLTFAGLDITTFVTLSQENRDRLLMRQSPLTDALSGLYTLWRFESYARPDPTLFDVVAVGMVLWPDLFTTREAHVRVTDEGLTVIDETKPANCRIGIRIDQKVFIDRIMERYLKQNLHRK